MDKKYQVSIVVPTLNEEKCIEYTLRSIQNQSFKQPYEVIVVDADSKDKTREIASKYARVINAKRKGVSYQLNLGVKNASGDILIFTGADIVLAPNLIESFVTVLKKTDIIGATCPIVPLSHKLKHKVFYWTLDQIKKTSIEIGGSLCNGGIIGITRATFDKVGGFDEGLNIGEDADFTIKASKYGGFAFLENTLVLTWPRREEKMGIHKLFGKWIGGYLLAKILKVKLDYPEIR